MMLVGYTERLGCLSPAFKSVLEAVSEPDPDAGRYPWRECDHLGAGTKSVP
jgi:hypothetical protein